ncbi:MAG: CHAT domain-containing protein [Gammaproteobacteria bacterium]|nr:CHAT domain-containing protein [Gammaproteobacteria bacterium]
MDGGSAAFILDKTELSANAIKGKGGSIKVSADPFIKSGDSRLDVSSSIGIDGRVLINAPDTDLGKEFMKQPKPLQEPALVTPCARRFDKNFSELKVASVKQCEQDVLCKAEKALRERMQLKGKETKQTVFLQIRAEFRRLPDLREKAVNLLALGRLWLEHSENRASCLTGDASVSSFPQTRESKGCVEIIKWTAENRNKIFPPALFKLFIEIAGFFDEQEDNRTNMRIKSFALGYLGRLHEIKASYAKAQKYTRQALFFAQVSDSAEVLYRWQWQLGRIFKKAEMKQNSSYPKEAENIENAIQQYGQAINSLERSRPVLSTAQFHKTVQPVYFELADLLLQQAAKTRSQERLREARKVVERFKAFELENYFQDECITKIQAKDVDLDEVLSSLDPSAAVLYPVLLPDRLELLLTFRGEIIQKTVSGDEADFRSLTTRWVNDLYRGRVFDKRAEIRARRLYDEWLIAPLETELDEHGTKTLVIVANGILRTLPFAALYDGKRFLIEKYALAVTPALALTDPKMVPWKNADILLGGLSQVNALEDVEISRDIIRKRENTLLPSVAEELHGIHELFGKKGPLLMDGDFRIKEVERALAAESYSVVHFATHGEFNPQRSFVRAYDGNITMDRLDMLMRRGRFRDNPVELLVLSACETARGDSERALGLAGVTLKAGVRSALASLWPVDDKATSQLMLAFYRQLKANPKISKAEALQNAQRQMLADSLPQYRHPKSWAGFLLIGNWL